MKDFMWQFSFLSVQTESDKSMYISETHSYIG